VSSSRQNIVITGGSGLLALNWARYAQTQWNTTLVLHQRRIEVPFAKTRVVDLLSTAAVAATLNELSPSLVIHTAGMTNVEKCEADPEGATRTNAEAPAILAKECRTRGIKLVSISTDHLFSCGAPFASEDSELRLVNVYARTKAAGESAVLDALPGALIARTNFFCWGPSYRSSFSDWIISHLRRGERVRLFTDVFFTPILADELARAVEELVALEATGIYNVVSDTRLSKFEFGRRLASIFGLDSSLIEPARLADYKSPAARPLEMSLSNSKLRRRLGRSVGDIDQHLRLLHEQEGWADIKKVQSL